MPTRRVIKAIVHNFLGTYTSRYTEYDRYWLFGVMVEKLERLEFDLLAVDGNAVESAIATAAGLAVTKFAKQLSLARLPMFCVREARLAITKLPGSVAREVNGRTREGHMLRFVIRVVSDQGKSYECEKAVFVAPHDPSVEVRSAWTGGL